jgi:hypothetical protein
MDTGKLWESPHPCSNNKTKEYPEKIPQKNNSKKKTYMSKEP